MTSPDCLWFRSLFASLFPCSKRSPASLRKPPLTRLCAERLEDRDCPSAPSIEGILFSDTAPLTNDTVQVQVVNPQDFDSDPISFKYEFFVNNELKQTTITPNPTATFDLSQPGFGDKGDELRVTVTPSDPFEAGTALSKSVLVANSAPSIVDASLTMGHDQVIDLHLLQYTSDVDGDALEMVVISDPENGVVWQNDDGTYAYYAAAGWTGTDTFTVSMTDGIDQSNTATITVFVVNSSPTATDGSYSVARDGILTRIDLTDHFTDDDYDPLRITIVAGPTYGTLTLNGDGKYFYQPAAQYVGTDSFTIRAFDGIAESNLATISIYVTQNAPVNPDGSYSVLHDRTLANLDFSVNNPEANGDPTQIVIAAGPAFGALIQNADGTYNYIPTAGWTGTDTVSVSANGSDPVIVYIHVTNDAPFAKRIALAFEAYNQLAEDLNFFANAIDADSDTLTFEIVTGPAYGSLNLNSSTNWYDYNAINSYTGMDSFSFRYFDGVAYSDIVSVEVLVYDDTVDPASPFMQDYIGTSGALYTGTPPRPQQGSIQQGSINCCWFVAAVAGAAGAWPQWMKDNMIVDNGDGTFTVTLPGATQLLGGQYIATVNPTLDTRTYSTANGDWLKILQMAAGKYFYDRPGRDPTLSTSDYYDYINLGGLPRTGVALVTGNSVDVDWLGMTSLRETRTKLQNAFAANKIVTTASWVGAGKGIVGGHVYTVLEYDPILDRIHLRNPWGTNDDPSLPLTWQEQQPGHAGGPITRTRVNPPTQADFWMSLEEFHQLFFSIAYEQ